MKITVLAVGKVKERFYREAIAEYTKRLGRYCRLQRESKHGAFQASISSYL